MLSQFKKIITSSILSLFFLFLGSPLLHAFAFENGGFIVTIGSSIGNCSYDAYYCEEIENQTYLCQLRSEISHHTTSNLREIPSNQLSQSFVPCLRTQQYHSPRIPDSLGKNYRNPQVPSLTFVRIIKIQV